MSALRINSAEIELNVVQCDTDSHAIASSPGIKVLRRPPRDLGDYVQNLFVLCSATQLRLVADLVSAANRRHQLRALLVRQDADPSWLPQMLERANLHTLRNTLAHSSGDVPRRVMHASTRRAQHQLIAKATVAGDKLFVISCAPTTYEIAFDDIPALAAIPHAEREEFEVDEDGVSPLALDRHAH